MEETKIGPKAEKLIINGKEITFKKDYAMRRYLSQHSARIRNSIIDELPSLIDRMNSDFSKEELLDLNTTDFFPIWYLYQKMTGINTADMDF